MPLAPHHDVDVWSPVVSDNRCVTTTTLRRLNDEQWSPFDPDDLASEKKWINSPSSPESTSPVAA